ncbi:hypothetical protein HID58_019093 [Brassica napus]|uniref:CG-1 domain-containing protein n=1 Tax=Brassica napus TaxID=3708 RepID=A0ABQ8DBV4_BRANA|nr:hypothetical protein HID58_019093 [Brassica napus]
MRPVCSHVLVVMIGMKTLGKHLSRLESLTALFAAGKVIISGFLEVGALIVKSKTSWLSAEEICKILKQAESKNLTESVEKPPIDSIGLFIFREKKFYDHWRWNDVGGSKRKRGGNNRLGKKKKLSGNDGCSVNVMESTGLLEDNYVRRVHRDSKNFGDELAVVHYRRLT